MTDGLGRRVAATDPATGEPVEHLELATELVLHTAFAAALAERVTRLAAVRHGSYVQVRRVDRPAIDRLVVVSSATPGRRLSISSMLRRQRASVPISKPWWRCSGSCCPPRRSSRATASRRLAPWLPSGSSSCRRRGW